MPMVVDPHRGEVHFGGHEVPNMPTLTLGGVALPIDSGFEGVPAGKAWPLWTRLTWTAAGLGASDTISQLGIQGVVGQEGGSCHPMD